MGFAFPETAEEQESPTDAWRRAPGDQGRTGAGTDTPARQVEEADPDPSETQAPDPDEGGGFTSDGLSLARRSQIAVLRDRLNAAADGAGSLRFLWRTDVDDAVTQIDAETFVRLGTPVTFDHENLTAVVGAWDAAAGVRLAAALASRATWHGITVRLPVADAVAWVPMTLSASPVLASGRSFSGFRGFGTIDIAQLELAPARERTARDHLPPDELPGVEPDMRRSVDREDAGVEPAAEAAPPEQHLGPQAGEPEGDTPDDMRLPSRPAPDHVRVARRGEAAYRRPMSSICGPSKPGAPAGSALRRRRLRARSPGPSR